MQVGTRMIQSSSIRQSSARQASNAYLLSWVAVAMGGLAYLGVAAVRPDLLSAVLPIVDPAQEQAGVGRTPSDVVEEVASLRRWVNDLQHEVAGTKGVLKEHAALTQTMAQRLAAAEDRLPPLREVGTKAGLQRQQGRQSAGPEPVKAAVAVAADPVKEVPPFQTSTTAGVANIKVLNTPATSTITTGSLPGAAGDTPAATSSQGFAAAKVIGTAPAPAATSPRGIVIGNSDSLETLRVRWGELSSRNGDALKDLSPKYKLAGDGRQAPFSLVAGPFGSNADATKTCAALKANGVACRVSDFGGSAF